jgi:hypothetical protein
VWKRVPIDFAKNGEYLHCKTLDKCKKSWENIIMKDVEKKSMEVKMKNLKMFIIIIILAVSLHGVSHAAIFANDLAGGDPGGRESGKSVESHVIEGSAYFFQAKMSIAKIFYEGEMWAKHNQLNVQACLNHIDDAITNLNNSTEQFNQAILLFKASPMSQEGIEKLKNYDYNKIIEERKLIREVMDQVKLYLITGDISGFYQKIVLDLTEIATRLYAIKGKLQNGVAPEMSEFWETLNTLESLTLFGNYGTLVGRSIL